MGRHSIGIISPAAPQGNSGNARTAERWSRMLAPHFQVAVRQHWSGEPLDLMIALHARRSAASIAAWKRTRRGDATGAPAPPDAAPLIVVLTGTDLYRDILVDAGAQRSLNLADTLVVLQDRGPLALPAALRGKARVIYQSTAGRQRLPKTRRRLHALMVAHLRREKSPGTLIEAARRLRDRPDIRIDLVGATLEPDLGARARAAAGQCPAFHWTGALEHHATMRRIQRAHVLVNCSRIEGGAHVVLEAVRCGTPVLASRIDGNVGMLGADYQGYFEPGDSRALAALLERCRDEPRMLAALVRQCRARARLFDPERERRALFELVTGLLRGDGRP